MVNLYHILELESTASLEEIKKSFKRLAMIYHPDRNPDDPEAEDKFKMINQAYQILSDEDLRQKYDYLFNNYHLNNIEETPPTSSRRRRNHVRHEPTEVEPEKPHMSNIVASFFSIILVSYLLLSLLSIYKFLSKHNYYHAYHAFNKGNIDESYNLLNNAIGHDHYFAPAHYLRGIIFTEHITDLEKALSDLNAAIAYQEIQNPDYYYRRGNVFIALKNKSEAITDFQRAIYLSKNDSLYFALSCEKMFYHLKDYQEVINFCKLAESKNIHAYELSVFKAKAFCMLMQLDEAQKLFQKNRIKKEKVSEILKEAASIYEKEYRYGQTLQIYEFLYRNDKSYIVLDKLLKMYISKGDYPKAYLIVNEIEKISLPTPNFYVSKAKIYLEIDSIQAACAIYSKAKNMGYTGNEVVLDAICQEDNFK